MKELKGNLLAGLLMLCIVVIENTKADRPFVALSALTIILFFLKRGIMNSSKLENNTTALLSVGFLIYCVYIIFYMCEHYLHL